MKHVVNLLRISAHDDRDESRINASTVGKLTTWFVFHLYFILEAAVDSVLGVRVAPPITAYSFLGVFERCSVLMRNIFLHIRTLCVCIYIHIYVSIYVYIHIYICTHMIIHISISLSLFFLLILFLFFFFSLQLSSKKKKKKKTDSLNVAHNFVRSACGHLSRISLENLVVNTRYISL